MDERYILAMQQYMQEARVDLDKLAALLEKDGSLDRLLLKSAERVLQTTIGACIGIAKHWVKQMTQYVPLDACDTFERLSQAGTKIDLEYWRSIIGPRVK